MKLFYRHIVFISLLITALCFTACNNKSIPTEIMDFKNNYENTDEQLDKLAKTADSCSKFYANDPIFLEKKSQIFFQKGRKDHKKSEYLEAAKAFIESYNAQKTLISLKKESDNDDVHYLGQILDNIGDVYADVNSLKPASYFYDQALIQFENASRQHEVIDMLLKIGDLYQHNHISNIALLNYETAEDKKNLTEDQYNLIQIKKGIALYDIFDVNSADSIYGRMWTKSPHLIEFQYFTGCHFYYNNKFDAALPYLLKCFEEGDAKIKVEAAEMLASIYFSLNQHDKELFYAQYQAKAQSAEARLTPVKMELESIYEQFVADNNPQKSDKSHSFNGLIWILIAVIIILIIGVIAFYQHTKRNALDQPTATENVEETPKRSYEEDYKLFVNSKIYNEIKESLEGKEILIKTVGDYPRLALTKVKLVTLTTTFNESFPNLTHSLLEAYPALTPADLRFIILSLMGFSNLEIAVLLKQTYSSANKRGNRIESILNTQQELNHFIPGFLSTFKY
ncbi:MAG: hypothetical protein J6T53_00740 [Bacteroidales bacterium]|nr:hypothetical protein [Bacteroidales bacterium]